MGFPIMTVAGAIWLAKFFGAVACTVAGGVYALKKGGK